MSKDVSFYLDTDAASEILTDMVAPTINKKAESIATRARAMAASISSNPPEITVSTEVGTIRRGKRAIATIRAGGSDARATFIGYQALSKSIDAGRD